MNQLSKKQAQAAIEYLLLLAVVVAIVLISLKTDIGRIYNATGAFFNTTANAILDAPPACGDGTCDRSLDPGTNDDNSLPENSIRCCADCPEPGGSCGTADGPPSS